MRRCGTVQPPRRWLNKLKILAFYLIVIAVCSTPLTADAASCGQFASTTVQIAVSEAPISMMRKFSLADLDAMSATPRHTPAPPVLGFYIGTVGFKLHRVTVLPGQMNKGGALACPRLDVEAELVAVERTIAVANDLSSVPCRLRAATDHYERHAADASLVLHQVAAELPRRLGPRIDQYLRQRTGRLPTEKEKLYDYVHSLLDEAVAAFTASLTVVQAAIDTPGEIYSLIAPCKDI